MKNKLNFRLALLGLCIGALGYWFQAYNQTTLFGYSIWALMGGASFLGGFAFRLLFPAKAVQIGSWMVLGILSAVLLRIVYDSVFWDPTSHNLAPFELAFTGLITFPAAFFGGLLGQLVNGTGKKK
jgi:hypothetical protein